MCEVHTNFTLISSVNYMWFSGHTRIVVCGHFICKFSDHSFLKSFIRHLHCVIGWYSLHKHAMDRVESFQAIILLSLEQTSNAFTLSFLDDDEDRWFRWLFKIGVTDCCKRFHHFWPWWSRLSLTCYTHFFMLLVNETVVWHMTKATKQDHSTVSELVM